MSNKKFLVIYMERGQEYGRSYSIAEAESPEDAVRAIRDEIDETKVVTTYELGAIVEFRFSRQIQRIE